MAAPKSRLGRGLGALIASGASAAPKMKPKPRAGRDPAGGAPAAPGFQEIAVHLVEPSPYQPRKDINAEQLSELVESIRAEGLLQPIVVRRVGDRFQLIAGERRWRAFQQLKIKSIPARVLDASDASSATLTLIENLQREGLNPIEEAYGYASLIRDFDLTQEQAAERVGKGRATVANSLRLLSLEAEIQGYIAKGLLSVGHAKVLLGVEDPARRAVLARRVIEEGLSVRVSGKARARAQDLAVRPAFRPGRAGGRGRHGDGHREAPDHAPRGARVRLHHSPKRGRIIIEYAGQRAICSAFWKKSACRPSVRRLPA